MESPTVPQHNLEVANSMPILCLPRVIRWRLALDPEPGPIFDGLTSCIQRLEEMIQMDSFPTLHIIRYGRRWPLDAVSFQGTTYAATWAWNWDHGFPVTCKRFKTKVVEVWSHL